MSKTVYTENTLDPETGELVSRKWITRKVSTTDHFVKMYLEDLMNLNKLSNADYRTLYSLAVYLEYNTNQFFLNKERRQELADQAGLKFNTINQSIARLIKKNLILKIASGLYQMNPKIFFNGDELERSKILEVVIRYEICADC